MRQRMRAPALLAATIGLSMVLAVPAWAAGGKGGGKGGGGGSGGGTTSTTYIKTYKNIVNGSQFSLTSEDLQPTSDGGHIALALTSTSNGFGASWLLKLDSTGATQWQQEFGCFNLPPGSYADALSLQQTADGGYIAGGGTIGCGSSTSACSQLSGVQCAYVVKLDSVGDVSWARVYDPPSGFKSAGISKIEQTSDGGYIAVGSGNDSNGNDYGMVLKLDSSGNVQWQQELSESGSTSNILLNAVQQTSEGGYIAAGQFITTSTANTVGNVFAVKLDSAGNIQWQHGFANLNSSGVPVDRESVTSVLQTSDGGYLIGGHWNNNVGSPSSCCMGGLLLKLDANGNIVWQNAYSNTVFLNGSSFQVGALINSIQPAANGNFLLAGSADLILADNSGVQLVPWIAQVDSSGNLLQQTLYTAASSTGRPVSDYFSAANPTSDGGALAAGVTEDQVNTNDSNLYTVRADSTGQVASGSCSEVHSATPLNLVNPGLAVVPVAVAVQTAVSPANTSPTTTVAGTPSVTQDC